MKRLNFMVSLYGKVLILLVVLSCATQILATEYGADLLNGIGGFETADGRADWTMITWVGDTAVNRFDSVLPHSGDWSWHVGPSTAYGQTWGINITTLMSTVVNREHRLTVYARTQTSTPSWINCAIGGSGWKTLTTYSSNWGRNIIYYTTGTTEDTLGVYFKMFANSANDNGFLDDVVVERERVMPTVYSDSVQSTLVIGRDTEVIFDTTPYTTYDPRDAFDPDIIITCDDAIITDVQWINDTEVSAKITASSTGQLQMTFRNEYSDMEFTYSMVAVNAPSVCGNLGTEFNLSDLNRDCVVNLADFAIFASEWQKCTDPNIEECYSGL